MTDQELEINIKEYNTLLVNRQFEKACWFFLTEIAEYLIHVKGEYDRAKTLLKPLFNNDQKVVRREVQYPCDVNLYNIMAGCHLPLGEVDESNNKIKRALRIITDRKDKDRLSDALTNATINLDLIDLEIPLEAINLARRAARFSSVPRSKIALYPQLMRLHVAVGQWKQAESLQKDFEDSIMRTRDSLPNNLSEEERERFDNLVKIYRAQFDVGRWEMRVYRGEQIFEDENSEKKEHRTGVAFSILLGESAIQREDFNVAKTYFEEALLESEKIADKHLIRMHLAYVFTQLSYYQAAKEKLDIEEEVFQIRALVAEPHQFYIRAAQTCIALTKSNLEGREAYLEKAKEYAKRGYQLAWSGKKYHWVYWFEMADGMIDELQSLGENIDKDDLQNEMSQQKLIDLPLEKIKQLIEEWELEDQK